MEDEEPLKAGAIIRNTSNFVQNLVNQFLANRVVAASVVVRGILLASNHVLGMEEVTVSPIADLIDNVGLQVAVDGARDIFSLACEDVLV